MGKKQFLTPLKSKTCICCKKVQPVENFKKSNTSEDGYSKWCRECTKIKLENKKNKNSPVKKDKPFWKSMDPLMTDKN